MTIVITAEQQTEIREAVAWARAHPIPWSVLKKSITPDQDSNMVTLADRSVVAEPRTPREVILPFGYRLNITCEEQPAGICLHLSMSTPTPAKTLPSPDAIEMILELLGLKDVHRRAWVEEFSIDGKSGGRAINVVAVMSPAGEGHA